MEIKGEKFINFLKKYGYYLVAGLVVMSITLTVLLVSLQGKTVMPGEEDPLAIDANASALSFVLPLSECSIAMDFAIDSFVFNETLGWFETNAGIALTSETSTDVLAACSGTVTDVYHDDFDGTVIKIKHNGEFSSTYASLDENVYVKIGDNISTGQKIGTTSNTRETTSGLGNHLYFELIQNNTEINPSDYLNLGNK